LGKCNGCGRYYCKECLFSGYYFCPSESCQEDTDSGTSEELVVFTHYFICAECGALGKSEKAFDVVPRILDGQDVEVDFWCYKCGARLEIDTTEGVRGPLKTFRQFFKKGTIIENLQDITKGNKGRSDVLLGNHLMRVRMKVNGGDPFLEATIAVTSLFSTYLLGDFLFDTNIFRFGGEEYAINPFRANLSRLNEKNSFRLYKMVAGNIFAKLVSEHFGLRHRELENVDIGKIIENFFVIYEFDTEDMQFFNELLKAHEEGEDGLAEELLFKHIFENVFGMTPPEKIELREYFRKRFEYIYRKVIPHGFREIVREIKEES